MAPHIVEQYGTTYSGAVYGTTYSEIVWYYSIRDASEQGYVMLHNHSVAGSTLAYIHG